MNDSIGEFFHPSRSLPEKQLKANVDLDAGA
jgi:hypothetical protein